jgi:hypothetical protein
MKGAGGCTRRFWHVGRLANKRRVTAVTNTYYDTYAVLSPTPNRASFPPLAGALCPQSLWKFRKNLFFIKSEKPFLIRPDLMYPDMVETGIGILFEFGDVSFRIGTANDLFRHILFCHHLRRLLEMGRDGQHL